MCILFSSYLILVIDMYSYLVVLVINLNLFSFFLSGLVFLVIFGILLIIQFICMILHRLLTLAHFLARAPYKFGHEYKSSWSYKCDEDIAAVADVKRAENLCRQRERDRSRRARQKGARQSDETTFLLKNEQI